MLHQLLPGLAVQFSEVFPELQAQLGFIAKVVKEEEETFLRTLGKGLKKIDDILEQAKQSGTIDGAAAFELYDTYGFPIDLTRLIALEQEVVVDEEGFEREMQVQKNRSRAATASDVEDWVDVASSAMSGKAFVGYDELSCSTNLLRYRKVTAKGQTHFQVVLEQTPFYAESGGQVGDTGTITMGDHVIEVLNTKKENDLIVHTVSALPETVSPVVFAAVNANRRKEITNHHTLTHLLHAALRTVLGTHVAQKGSLVSNDGMRFDFSHFAKMTDEELAAVTAMVNAKIRENIPVVIREMDKEEAMKLGAMALFGEKYGEKVRVVTIDPDYSIELCGGTHVSQTGALGQCMILSESGVAAGVRRIEAVCGIAADQKHLEEQHLLKQVSTLLKNPRELVRSIEQHLEELSTLKKQLEQTENRLLGYLKAELVQKAEVVNGINFIGVITEASSSDSLKKLCNDLRSTYSYTLVVLAANISGKPAVAVGLSDTLVTEKGLDAVVLIKTHVAGHIKGGGGGQKSLASAGGQEVSGLSAAIAAIKNALV
jgi:alanyl-tRNA synthetase